MFSSPYQLACILLVNKSESKKKNAQPAQQSAQSAFLPDQSARCYSLGGAIFGFPKAALLHSMPI